jgi:hypothetical protein
MYRHFKVFLLGAALALPLAVPVAMTADDDRHRNRTQRYYDRDARDYHEWNQNERQAYGVYLGEQHRKPSVTFTTKRKEQQHYFKWRHDHSDSVLRIEVR